MMMGKWQRVFVSISLFAGRILARAPGQILARRVPLLLLALVPILPWGLGGRAAWAQEPGDLFGPFLVEQILFEGNRRTREPIMRQEIRFAEGQVVNYWQLDQARQDIMNLGLFRAVDLKFERADLTHPEISAKAGQEPSQEELKGPPALKVVFVVREKFYYFVLPQLSRTADGDIRYGGELRADNWLGHNHQVSLRWSREIPSDPRVEEIDSLLFRYRIPRLLKKRQGLGLSVEDSRGLRILGPGEGPPDISDRPEAERQYLQQRQVYNLSMQQWLNQDGRTQGWRFVVEGLVDRRDYEATPGLAADLALPVAGQDVRGRWGLIFSEVNDYDIRREGVEYGGVWNLPLSILGADFHHQGWDFFYRQYISMPAIFSRGVANLNLQLRAGWTTGNAFRDRAYTLGGSGAVRGLDPDYRVGERQVLINVEYLTPLFGYHPLRGVLFTDFGEVWEKGASPKEVAYAGGLGLRWNLRWFVRTQLRLDVAYAPEQGQTRVYAGTNSSF